MRTIPAAVLINLTAYSFAPYLPRLSKSLIRSRYFFYQLCCRLPAITYRCKISLLPQEPLTSLSAFAVVVFFPALSSMYSPWYSPALLVNEYPARLLLLPASLAPLLSPHHACRRLVHGTYIPIPAYVPAGYPAQLNSASWCPLSSSSLKFLMPSPLFPIFPVQCFPALLA